MNKVNIDTHGTPISKITNRLDAREYDSEASNSGEEPEQTEQFDLSKIEPSITNIGFDEFGFSEENITTIDEAIADSKIHDQLAFNEFAQEYINKFMLANADKITEDDEIGLNMVVDNQDAFTAGLVEDLHKNTEGLITN
jgi:hypothetical protein